MANYESPQISFNKLTLFEKIANPCWGATQPVGFDDPYADTSGFEHVINVHPSSNTNCGVDELKNFAAGVEDYFDIKYQDADDKYYNAWYNKNIKPSYDKGQYLQETKSKWTYVPVS